MKSLDRVSGIRVPSPVGAAEDRGSVAPTGLEGLLLRSFPGISSLAIDLRLSEAGERSSEAEKRSSEAEKRGYGPVASLQDETSCYPRCDVLWGVAIVHQIT